MCAMWRDVLEISGRAAVWERVACGNSLCVCAISKESTKKLQYGKKVGQRS